MNKETWNELFLDEIRIYGKDAINVTGPENWNEEKQKLLNFVESVDKATEIYNMENGIKG